jgi:tRNA 2-thiouridine synthesizing protein A
MSFNFEQELDCTGMACPMPILKTKKAMDALQTGQVLRMISTDPGSVPDVEAWTSKTGHELLKHEKEGEKFIFYIKRK